MSDYQSDPLEYARALIDTGDKYYDVHRDEIDKAKKHYQLKSDHMTIRGSIPGRKGHYIPELHPAIFSRASRIFNAFLQGDPALKFNARSPAVAGSNPMLDESINRLETWVNGSFKEGGLWMSWFEAILAAEMYPYSPVYLGWEEKFGPVPQYNMLQNKIDYKDYIIYAGSYLDAIPIENYRGDLKARRQSDMTFHARIKQVDLGYIRSNAKQGYYPFFDEMRINDIKKSHWAIKRTADRLIQGYEQVDDEDIDLIEVYCKIYDEESDQNVWRIVTFAGSMLLNERSSPYFDLGAPFRLLTSKILPGETSGIPTAQLGDATQNMLNELWNQTLEGNEQAVWSPTLYKGDAPTNPVWEPMSLWQVEDPDSFRKLVEPNLAGDSMGFIKFTEERLQQTLNAYDITQPLAAQSKQTLGEYQSKNQYHNDIMNVTLNIYGDALCDLTKMSLIMAREMLPTWISLKMFGPNSILSQITLADLAADLVIDTPKVRGITTEEVEIVKWQGIYSQLMSNPLIGANLGRLHELTRRFLESQDVKGIDKIIGTPEEAIMQAQMMAQINALAMAGQDGGRNGIQEKGPRQVGGR